MAYVPADVVRVDAWGETVGAVAMDPATGRGLFEYSRDWRTGARELSPLLAPNSHGLVPGEASSPETFHGLPPFLADSLPDDFGNAIVDAYLAREGIPSSQFGPLDRLVYAGNRAIGALEFYPPSPREEPPTALDLSELVSEARHAIRGDLEDRPSSAIQALLSVGTSAGGARAKAVVAINDAGRIRSGSVPPERGWTDYILKFDGTANDDHATEGYTRIEYAYHLMAIQAGIEVPPARLLEEGGRAHFLTQRFDRVDGQRLHVQSLCAMRGLDFRLRATHDYGQYFQTITDIGLGPDALTEAFRRAAFNVLAYNRDDHTKNFAFLMDPAGTWRLAPAFDVTFSYAPDSYWTARHMLGIDGVFDNPTRADLERLGDTWAVPGYGAALQQVADAVAEWPAFAKKAGVEPERSRAIAHILEGRI